MVPCCGHVPSSGTEALFPNVAYWLLPAESLPGKGPLRSCLTQGCKCFWAAADVHWLFGVGSKDLAYLSPVWTSCPEGAAEPLLHLPHVHSPDAA